MRKYCLFSFVFLIIAAKSNAQYPHIDSGTVLTYNVTQYDVKFTYKVTVTSAEPFELKWKAAGPKTYSGQSLHYDSAFEYSSNLLIKPNFESVEYTSENDVRLMAPHAMCIDIADTSVKTMLYDVDGYESDLDRYKEKTKIKNVNFNGKPINFISAGYKDAERGFRVSFMPYNIGRFWVYYFKDENTLMELVSIDNG